jgi:hypothetical protein
MTATMILPIGNTGCGKTLLSKRFVLNDVVRVCLDDVLETMHGTSLFSEPKLAEVYRQIEEDAIAGALTRGLSVYVDRPNIDRKTRARYISLARFVSEKRAQRGGDGVKVVAFDFGPGTEGDVMRRRLAPKGHLQEAWERVSKCLSVCYEPAVLDEGFAEIVPVDNNYFKFYAIDFDGVIVDDKFPAIGPIVGTMVNVMRRLWHDPHNYIIVYTCREDSAIYKFTDRLDITSEAPNLRAMSNFLTVHRIPHDTINFNPWNPGGRKVFAHYYIDDRNLDFDKHTSVTVASRCLIDTLGGAE